MTQIILGSQSPRRQEIFEFFDLSFEQVPPPFTETDIEFTGDVPAYVTAIAEGKAQVLVKQHPDDLIITADTTVYYDGKIFGKPANKEEGCAMLTTLSGQWHQVFSAVSITHEQRTLSDVAETRVLMNALTTEEITKYCENLLCEDKAGAYAIQGAGGLIVNKIEGCFYNVMGLPINTLRQLLQNFGIDLWNHLQISS